MSSVERVWGDGVGDKRDHVIEDIAYTGAPTFIQCRCGTRVEAPTPATLAGVWVAHGGRTVRLTDDIRADAPAQPLHVRLDPRFDIEDFHTGEKLLDSSGEPIPLYIVPLQWEPILAAAERCACDTIDITECPNYRPGDEEVDDE